MTESKKQPEATEQAKQPAPAPKPDRSEMAAEDLNKVTGGATMVERNAG
ncbi:MAG TPA: hypothetical protein VHW90_13315 [Stellaceae bacterium]|jgi:hypothetical protein|nr:hypothetical protein [Stellaceae bacterium]